ncbi:ABC transporter permease [Paenibacillus tarimensis]
MSLLAAYIKLNLKIMFQYRKSFLISALIHPMELVVGAIIFTSVYAYGNFESIHGYSLSQIVWYIGGMQIVGTIIWNFAAGRMSNHILDGTLSIYLLKPASIFKFELANAIALRTVGILFEFIPILIIQTVIFFPSFMTAASTLKFVLCAVLSFFLFFLLNFIIGMAAFFIKNNGSIIAFRTIMTSFVGGTIIPLEFFPGWLQRLSEFLPFRYLYYEPLQFFLNREAAQSMAYFGHVIAMQLLWITLFFLTIKLSWPHVIKRYCAVGG